MDKGFVHSLHQVIITSLLEDKKKFKHGVANGYEEQKERRRKKEEERK